MLDITNRVGYRQTPETRCVAEAYAERTEQAQKDLLLILEYLAERTHLTGIQQATDEEIEEAARLCATPYRSLEEAQKGEIWVLMNRLSSLIAPATVEGLRATRRGSSSLAGWPTLLIGVICTFVLALALQMYTLFGGQTLVRLNELNAEQGEVNTKININEEHKPELYEFGLKLMDPKFVSSEWQKSTPEYAHLRRRWDAINVEQREVFRNIYQWNAAWGVPLAYLKGQHPGDYWGFECKDDNSKECKSFEEAKSTRNWKEAPFGDIQIRYGSEAFARANLETLRGLVLPVLYGALGAWVWLLRRRYRQVIERSLRSPVWGEYLQRVLLGAVFGAALGYLLTLPSFLPDWVANISLIGLAFIVGYNVEVVFWAFDQMLSTLREKGAEQKLERARRREVAKRREVARPAGATPPSGAPT